MVRIFFITLFTFYITAANAQKEVIYQVFQRSFFDSNGDGNGDLPGITQKLDYLGRLGVTTIVVTPLYQSDFYHNRFATDFEKIDPEYGSFKEYRDLVQEVHRRKMKIYQDVAMQYIAGKHPWFTDSYKTPSSKYSSYVYYNDKKNEKPWYFFDTPEFTTYNNQKEQIIVVNLKDPKVKEYTYKVLKYWMDPDGNGSFYDGVDGFRLDHMMYDLDNAGKLINLFKDFWAPLLADLKKINPDLKIVAAQANRNSYGYEYFTKGTTDRVLAFRLQQAISTFDKKKIIAAADSTFIQMPGKEQVVFLENTDTKRFATVAGADVRKLKIGAALNILMGGVPLLYYGQELGMQGEPLKGSTDGNEIPLREAFEWYANTDGPGMALWYKDTGQWWDKRNAKPNDGISLEEQQKDPNSLFNYYRLLLHLHKMENAIAYGSYNNVPNRSQNVFSFTRTSDKGKVLVMINLSGTDETVTIDDSYAINLSVLKLLSGSDIKFPRGGRTITLPPYAVQVWRVLHN